MRKGYTLTVAN